MSEFVHLHVHSEYSLLDGSARIKNIINKTAEYKMKSVALTDHGALYGYINFYKNAIKIGIKPIIGCEVYVAGLSRFDKKGREDDIGSHLVLLAENNKGLKNIIKLVSKSFLEGFYYKPRVDKQLLGMHSEGIIALSGCLGGEIPKAILKNNFEDAKKIIEQYKIIFGEDNFFLELQNHNLQEQLKVNTILMELSHRTDTPVVATNDIHYIEQSHSKVHDILLCIQTNSKLNDIHRFKFATNEFWFKPQRLMEELFPEDKYRNAIINSGKIARRCNIEIEFNKIFLPAYPLQSHQKASNFLRELCEKLLQKRYKNGDVSIELVREKMNNELQIIEQMGFCDYFLIVWDFIQFARENKIPVGPGRGSSAGSIVAYILGITNIDPIKYGLLFERFLNPKRSTMPDIDTDVCYVRRQEIIDYIVDKYGKQQVGQIATFGTMAAKAAIKDVARVMGIPFADIDKVCKVIPKKPNITILDSLKESSELSILYHKNEKIKEIIELALELEGMPRHVPVHAAGIVISKSDLSDYIPVQLNVDKGIVTQLDKDSIEEIGLLKMDLLGLRNLTIIQDTVNIIKDMHGKNLDIERIPLNDEKVAQMLCVGNTQCLFQLESEGMTKLIRDFRPKFFNDLIPILALHRPATIKSGMVTEFLKRRRGEIPIDYLHSTLEPILKETLGIILYQEQVMQIANIMGGFSLTQADIVRRAMGGKKSEVLAAQKEKFIAGALKKGYEKKWPNMYST